MKTYNLPYQSASRHSHSHRLIHWILFVLMTFGLAISAASQSCSDISCSGTITVDQNVTINFNTSTPTYSGDVDLQPYFTYDKSGATADTWKAIFDLGSKKLLLKNGATITVTNVPNSGSNQRAPGIYIKTTCDVEIENGGKIIVSSTNMQAGGITIEANGHVTINGTIKDEVKGSQGLPGAISISSKFGNMTIGSTGLVETLGKEAGGNSITLSTCGAACYNGDITVSGLVMAYCSEGHPAPSVKIVAANGALTVNANSTEPLYDEYNVDETKYDLFGGILSWIGSDDDPGQVEIQTKGNVTVNGHGDDPTAPVRKSFGAIAAVSTDGNAPGGIVEIHALQGSISGNNRSFDVSGRNRNTVTYANIRLFAKYNITLTRSGANSSFNPVVDASASNAGDQPGINEIRSYAGSITIGANATISASVPGGSLYGNNYLTSCGGVTNNGIITPADPVSSDDHGTCTVPAPQQLYMTSCAETPDNTPTVKSNVRVRNSEEVNLPQLNTVQIFPNPFNQSASVNYKLIKPEIVIIKVFNMGGKEVAKLTEGPQQPGQYSIQWNASAVPDGVYIVKMQAGEFTGVNKIVKVR